MGLCIIEGGAGAGGGSGKGEIEVLGQIDITNAVARGFSIRNNVNIYFLNNSEGILAQNVNINDYTYLAIEAITPTNGSDTTHPYSYLQIYINNTTDTNNKLGDLGFNTLRNWAGNLPNNQGMRYSYFFSPVDYNNSGISNGNIVIKFTRGGNDNESCLQRITLYGIKGEIKE